MFSRCRKGLGLICGVFLSKEIDTDDFEIELRLTRTDGNQFQPNLEIGPTIQQKFVSETRGLNDKHSELSNIDSTAYR